MKKMKIYGIKEIKALDNYYTEHEEENKKILIQHDFCIIERHYLLLLDLNTLTTTRLGYMNYLTHWNLCKAKLTYEQKKIWKLDTYLKDYELII